MIKYFTVFVFLFLLSIDNVVSQENGANSELVVLSETGLSFSLFINGKVQNNGPDTLVFVKGLEGTSCQIKVEIAEKPIYKIEKLIIFSKGKVSYFAIIANEDKYSLVFKGEKEKGLPAETE